MNVWRFDERIFAACRDVERSPRGEFELPEAVRLAIQRGVRFAVVPAQGPVLRSLATRGCAGRRRASREPGDPAVTSVEVVARTLTEQGFTPERCAFARGAAAAGVRGSSSSDRRRGAVELARARAGSRCSASTRTTAAAARSWRRSREALRSPRSSGRTGSCGRTDARNDELCEIHLDAADTPNGWRSYVAVTARRLAANFPGADLGADIAFTSDLPRAAGMSSSSALIIALANVLIRRGRLENARRVGGDNRVNRTPRRVFRLRGERRQFSRPGEVRAAWAPKAAARITRQS